MTNYGGLMILDREEWVREWDTAAADWNGTRVSFNAWYELIARDGDDYMKED